ncbi:MAG: hypothetical protein DDT42_01166 [candidate division WS2 bacterium]|uniref:DUF6922 domain-containing protein n=1 Tax=Psychracetigena formicireducens TaxID=2986056 RepID=A0A9E2BIP6_PSYF1|nr:hypothetical protein [Candidatus Psychracetigena formicireducens]MBT9145296.1 hypothetical protein [Candidatus Psychracetigena formicireducens]
MISSKIRKYFWDVNIRELDASKHSNYIIERLLELGDREAVKWLKKTYSEDTIIEVVNNSRNLSPKSRNYWEIIYNLKH